MWLGIKTTIFFLKRDHYIISYLSELSQLAKSNKYISCEQMTNQIKIKEELEMCL